MMTLVLAVALLVASSGAAAEWTAIGETTIGDVYVDLSTIGKSGDLRRFSSLFDFKAPQTASFATGSFRSMRTQLEVNCKDDGIRARASLWHSGQMGQGDVVASRSIPDAWESAEPGSVRRLLVARVCK